MLACAHRAETLSLGFSSCPRSVRLEAIKAWSSQRPTAAPTTHGEAPPAPLAAQGVRGLSLTSRPSPGGRAIGSRSARLFLLAPPVPSRPRPAIGSRAVGSRIGTGSRSGPAIGSRAVDSRIGTGAVGSPAVGSSEMSTMWI